MQDESDSKKPEDEASEEIDNENTNSEELPDYEEDNNLDMTRMNNDETNLKIPVRDDLTNTKVKINSADEPTDHEYIDAEKTKKSHWKSNIYQVYLRSKAALLSLINKLPFNKIIKTKKKSADKKSPSKIKEKPSLLQQKDFLRKIPYFLIGLIALALQTSPLISVMDTGLNLKWVYLVVFLISLVSFLLSLILRWRAESFLIPLIGLLILMSLQTYFYSSSNKVFFYFLSFSLYESFNIFYISMIFIQLLFLVFIGPKNIILRLIVGLLYIYPLTVLIPNIIAGIAMEASWLSYAWINFLPHHWLSPLAFFFQFVFPIAFFINLIFVFFNKQKSLLFLLNALVLLLMSVISFSILRNAHYPSFLTTVMPGLDIKAQLIIDTKDDKLILEIKNENLSRGDLGKRYVIELKNKKIGEALVSIENSEGVPLYFLTKKDFIFYSEKQRQVDWGISLAENKDLKRYKVSQKDQKPYYLLKYKSQGQKNPISLNLPSGEPKFQSSDLLEIRIDNKFNATSYQILSDGQVVHEEEVKKGNLFKWSLQNLDLGSHSLEIVLKSDKSEARLKQEILIEAPLKVNLVHPSEGDFFADHIKVFVSIGGTKKKDVARVLFYLADELVAEKDDFPYYLNIPTSDLPNGPHKLRVEVELGKSGLNSESFVKSININKGPHPEIIFKKPSFASFLSLQNEIELEASSDFEKLDLYFNEKLIHTWKEPPYTWDWNTAELDAGTYYLKAIAKTKEGLQVSTWTEVQTGKGELVVTNQNKNKSSSPLARIKPTTTSGYDRVVFVLDVSQSQLDIWDSKSKWDQQFELLSGSKLKTLFSKMDVGFVAMGSEKRALYEDCEDVSWISDVGRLNSYKLLKDLSEMKPRGVNALFESLHKALAVKPDKVVVLTDSSDHCTSKIPSSLLKKLKEVPVDIISMGAVSPSDAKILERITKSSGGNFSAVNTFKEFEEKALESLSLFYYISLFQKQVLSSPVNGEAQQLRPGKYQFRLSLEDKSSSKDILIKNGLRTEIQIDDKGRMSQSYEAIY